MLHIINTPLEHKVLFARISQEDALLFTADAVLCLHKKSQAAKTILAYCQQLQCHVLEADLFARGLTADDILSEITLVDYKGFVALTIEHKVIKTWY